MATNKTYREKILDPRWQKKRLEVFQRDNFSCVYCGDSKSTLHVHHVKYENGLNPWEYDIKYLKTACHICHEDETGYRKIVDDGLVDKLRFCNIGAIEIYKLLLIAEFNPTLLKEFISENIKDEYIGKD